MTTLFPDSIRLKGIKQERKKKYKKARKIEKDEEDLTHFSSTSYSSTGGVI